jgi:hypothetical protein
MESRDEQLKTNSSPRSECRNTTCCVSPCISKNSCQAKRIDFPIAFMLLPDLTIVLYLETILVALAFGT